MLDVHDTRSATLGEIYISVDVEADGPIPGLNSMLSFGAAAFSLTADDPRAPLATFEANLETLGAPDWPQCQPHPETMRWWATQPEAWEACRRDLQAPTVAMPAFVAWLSELPGKPVLVGYPVTFDFMFVYWYTIAFGGVERAPFGFQGLDIKTLMADRLGLPYRSATKRRVSKLRPDWFEGLPEHNHEALTDAIEQGILFVNMQLSLRTHRGRSR